MPQQAPAPKRGKSEAAVKRSPYPPEESIGHQVRWAHRALQREIEERLKPFGITNGMWYFLRALWEEELAGMRVRIKQMRQALQDKLKAAGVARDMSFITQQKGMFSYSGLGKAQMQRLRSELGIYGVDSGRICVAALNSRNLDAVVAAIAKVM